jgi:prepilin-type N-terminal cleavage/methylation domain-containing protein
MRREQAGYTLVELMVTMAVLAVLGLGAFTLFTSLLHSAIVAQRQAVASALATNQTEYIKSLPYDHLAVAGGAIVSTTTIPASFTKKVQGVTYTVTTSITYADDAYDGCGSYPNQTLKTKYCRNYPPPSGAPSTDNNPGDYKDITVTITDPSGTRLASIDTHVAALVAETASNTGALFVSVVDDSGQPVVGATVNVINSSTSPAVNVSDTTDQNGLVIFYDLPPSTTNYHYQVTGSKSGYSTLTTIVPSGTLQPTYPSQNLLTQSSSYVTLTIKPQGSNSLIIEITDTTGNPLSGVKVYVKGGYKKYTATSDTSYYYDNLSPSDTRPTTDSSGLTALFDLVPGSYIFCGDAGATSCKIGNTTYYLAAAVPYGGSISLQPITVPIYDATNPPATTFSYNGVSYLQKVRLMLTTNSSFPRVASLSPYDVSATGGTLSNFAFTVKGANLPCSSSASSCSTSVKFQQGSSTFTASCTGSSAGIQLNCTVNLSSAVVGSAQLIITVGSNTLTLPSDPLQGDLDVTP